MGMILNDNTLADGFISSKIESFEQTLGNFEDMPSTIRNQQSFHHSKIVRRYKDSWEGHGNCARDPIPQDFAQFPYVEIRGG